MKKRVPEDVIEDLADFAATWTGFSRDAIFPDAIRRALGKEPPEEVLRRARRRDPEVVHTLCQAVSVGETFFFRHPEHFRYLASKLIPRRLQEGATHFRAWSAGCATGEEAWSLAACLLDLLPPPVTAEVLATDLIDRNLEAAREGVYGAWSRRASGPILHPVFHGKGERVRVDERVRKVVRFSRQNLLEEPPPGPFDVIFCRNVLVYFSPEATGKVMRHLVSALSPQGAIFFGPMDVSVAPPGLAPAGLPEQQIWSRPEPAAPVERKPSKRHHPPAPLPTPPPLHMPPPEPVAFHLRALRHIDRGERQAAEKELAELCKLVPDYVPGIVERALLKLRSGEQAAAATLMREVLRRTARLPPEELLPGPEPLPVSFYRESADSLLRGTGADR
jgi:chemotaxis methyl-accepting protein methylase